MATQTLQALEIRAENGGVYLNIPEASTETFKRGEVVTLSSGLVASLSGTDPTAGTIFGIAMHDAAGDGSKAVIFVPTPDSLIVGNIYHATQASAVTAATDRDTNYGIVEASNKVHVDKADTTNTRVLVVDLDTRDAVGDIYGRIVFKFMAASLQTSGAVS